MPEALSGSDEAIRDLFISVQLNAFDEPLQAANAQVDDLVARAGDMEQSLDSAGAAGLMMGSDLDSGLSRAQDAMEGVAAGIDSISEGIVGVVTASALMLKSFATEAAQDEMLMERLAIAAGDSYGEVAEAFRQEMVRTKFALADDDLIQYALPILGQLPGQSKEIVKLLEPLDNALIKTGLNQKAMAAGWMAIGRALTGSYEMLTKASRRLPVALVTGEEALKTIEQISSDNAPVENLRILIEAFNQSVSMSGNGIDRMMTTTEIRLKRFSNAVREFKENAGREWSAIWGEMAEAAIPLVAVATEHSEQLSRFLTLFSAAAAPFAFVGGLKLLDGLLSKVFGVSLVATLPKLGAFVALLGMAVLLLEDLYRAMRGMDSFGIFGRVARGAKEYATVKAQAEYELRENEKGYTQRAPWFLRAAQDMGMTPDQYIAMQRAEYRYETGAHGPGREIKNLSDKEFYEIWKQLSTGTDLRSAADFIGKESTFTVELPDDAWRQIVAAGDLVATNRALSGKAFTYDMTRAVQEQLRSTPESDLYASRADDFGATHGMGPALEATATLPNPWELTPEQLASGRVPVSVSLSIAPGAIQITDAKDSKAVADEILEMMKKAAVEAIEKELRGAVEEQAREAAGG